MSEGYKTSLGKQLTKSVPKREAGGHSTLGRHYKSLEV
jgi:hypothetical protein